MQITELKIYNTLIEFKLSVETKIYQLARIALLLLCLPNCIPELHNY